MQRRVKNQAGVHAFHAVAFGGQFGVVPSGEALQLGPTLPSSREGALVAAGFEFGCGQSDLRPCLRQLVGRNASCLKGIHVEPHHGGRAVERERHHLAVGRCVITGHGGHIGFGVKFITCIAHDFFCWDHHAFGSHHGGSAHFKHLQNMWGIASAEGGYGGRHGFVVVALEDRNNFVIFLFSVEIFGNISNPLAQGTGHRVPPLNFSLGLGAEACKCGHSKCGKCFFVVHKFSFGGWVKHEHKFMVCASYYSVMKL